MNLKICSPQLGMSPLSSLGGEVYDRNDLLNMAAWGAKIHVYLPSAKPHDTHKNLIIDDCPLTHVVPPSIYNFFWVPWAIKLYQQKKFQILNIHSPEYLGLGALVFKKIFPQVKLVFHFHLGHTGFVFKNIDKFCLPKVDGVICDSAFLAREVAAGYGVDKEKIFVNHCGTDLSIKRIPPDKKLIKKYGFEGKRVMIFMGRLIARKNPVFLIEILRSLRERGNDAALIIVGEGPEKVKIQEKINEHDLQKFVCFPGFLRAQDKINHYAIADVFVFPSNNEGFVLVVLEALAAGLPLVVPKDKAFPEAVKDGDNGFLAVPNDLSDWVNKLEKLLTNKKLREKFGVNSRKRAEQEFDWRQMSKRNIKIYEKILGVTS